MTLLALSDPALDTFDAPATVGPVTLKRYAAVALAAIAVLNLADIITTRVMLAHGAIESNPLSALLLQNGRVEILKAVLLGLLALRIVKKPTSLMFSAALWFGAGIYTLTVISNLLIINRIG